MNNLGGMVFLVAGIAMGYWVVTGRAQNFLYALRTGQQGTNNSSGASSQTSQGSWGTPSATSIPAPLPTASSQGMTFNIPTITTNGNEVPQNKPYYSGNPGGGITNIQTIP